MLLLVMINGWVRFILLVFSAQVPINTGRRWALLISFVSIDVGEIDVI